MNDEIIHISEKIKKHLLAFKQNDVKTFDKFFFVNSVEKLNVEIDINDERLKPQSFGWSKDDECPSLEWLSFIIISYLSGHSLSPKVFLLILRTINYHGFWGLLDLFENEGQQIFYLAKNDSSEELLYSYYQLIAKYYKGVGIFDKAQIYYLQALKLAKNIKILPYAFSLQSKLNADYLLRNGMAKEYGRISYEYANKSDDFKRLHPRRYIICLDTFAKYLYDENPENGEKLYQELLILSKDYPLSLNRIEFRYLEAKISFNIKNENFKQIPYLLKKYNQKLESILDKNPKARYIRTLHYLGFFRELIVLSKINNEWFVKKGKELLNVEAEILIKKCIREAQSFRDRRFIAIGYYELSFWMIRKGKIDDAIINLKKGLEVFGTDIKSTINIIYTKFLKLLANLYGRKLDLDLSLHYYKNLYENLRFLTSEFQEHKKSLEKYLPNFDLPNNDEITEFSFLEIEDRKKMYMSILTHYESLVKSLLEYGNFINRIQEIDLKQIKENTDKQNYLISHDLRKNYNNFLEIKSNLENIKDDIRSKNMLDNELKNLSREISNMGNNIDSYEKVSGVTILEEIDVSSEAQEYIRLSQSYYETDVKIEFSSINMIRAKFRSFDLYELISNLIRNVYSTGHRNEINPIAVDIKLYEEVGIVYLTCSDNCGDYSNFNNIIQDLNSKNPIQGKKNVDGYGIGLTFLKGLLDSYNLNMEWSLSGNEELKTLIIPLTKSV